MGTQHAFLHTTTRVASAMAATALLAACAAQDIAEIKTTPPQGSPFSRNLALEYLELASFEEEQMHDHIDAATFAAKGLQAVRGGVPEPESLDDWNLPETARGEVAEARRKLTGLLGPSRTERAPRLAARAQARFDCWVEQQEENWQTDHIRACRKGFYAAMAALERLPRDATEPATANEVTLFFDFDSRNVSWIGERLLDTVAAEALDRPDVRLAISGHADRSGTTPYNRALSAGRAKAVASRLMRRGVPRSIIETASLGEARPRVPTPDEVREPENRRVEIRFVSE